MSLAPWREMAAPTNTSMMPGEGESRYLTVAEAARLLGFPLRTITRWVNEGRLPHVVIEGEKRLAPDDVRAILERPAKSDDG